MQRLHPVTPLAGRGRDILAPMVRWIRPLLGASAIAVAQIAAEPSARADDVEQARVAYERATDEFNRADYPNAARDFARADELAPSPSRLTIALKTVALTDDAVLGMTLVDRAASRRGDPELDAAAQKAREKFVSRASKLTVRCAEGRPCTASVDAQPAQIGVAAWVTPGDHVIGITEAERNAKFKVTLLAGAAVDWQAPQPRQPRPRPVAQQPAPAPAPSPQPVPSTTTYYTMRPSSAWFWAGFGVTAVLGGVTAWSGVDTLSKHSAYIGGDDSALGPGKAAQTRTNALLGATIVAGAVTVVLGAVTLGRSQGSASTSASISAGVGPGGISVKARY